MPGLLNDAQFNVDKNGMITSGFGGFADGAGNPTYPYAKNDVNLGVLPDDITSDTQPALTYDTGDLLKRTLVASTTHKVAIQLPLQLIRTTATVTPSGGANPATAAKGILIKSLALFYRVNTNPLTSFTTFAINSAPLAAAAALPAVTAMTTTLAGNTLTNAANVYAAVATVTTPAWQTTQDLVVWAVATIVTPASCTCDIYGASWRIALALF